MLEAVLPLLITLMAAAMPASMQPANNNALFKFVGSNSANGSKAAASVLSRLLQQKHTKERLQAVYGLP